jgi:hypothetical protein
MDTDIDTDMDTDMDMDMETDMDTDMDKDMKSTIYVTLDPHEENTSGGIYYVWGGGRRKIHLVESTMSGKEGGRLEQCPYLADKCRALRNNYKTWPIFNKDAPLPGLLSISYSLVTTVTN